MRGEGQRRVQPENKSHANESQYKCLVLNGKEKTNINNRQEVETFAYKLILFPTCMAILLFLLPCMTWQNYCACYFKYHLMLKKCKEEQEEQQDYFIRNCSLMFLARTTKGMARMIRKKKKKKKDLN